MDVVRRTLAAALQHPAQEIIYAIAMVAGVSRELAARILRDPSGEPAAVLAKALGVGRDDFYAAVRDSGGPLAPRADVLLAVFDAMARDFSRAILRYWDWDGNPRIAAITRLLGLDDPVE